MRYLDWDILLFSSDTRIPTQEFRTQCFVVQDLEQYIAFPNQQSPAHSSASGPGFSAAAEFPARQFNASNGYQLRDLMIRADRAAADIRRSAARSLYGGRPMMKTYPVVTCFVTSQTEGSPFRVSVHNWDHDVPRISEAQSELVQEGKVAAFEVRVHCDGVLAGGDIVTIGADESPAWPKIIDRSLLPNKFGEQNEPLGWPKFHREMLTNMGWEAGESFGRIKITIAEGWKDDISPDSPFRRIKTIVAFAFQHAPLEQLEISNIAWPNRNMWITPYMPQGSQSLPAGPRRRVVSGVHGHTAQDRQVSASNSDPMVIDPASYGRMMPPPLPGLTVPREIKINPVAGDPFLEPYTNISRRAQAQQGSGESDLTMADWPMQHSRHTYNRLAQQGEYPHAFGGDSHRSIAGNEDQLGTRLSSLDESFSGRMVAFGTSGTDPAMTNTPAASPQGANGIQAPQNTRASSNISNPIPSKIVAATPSSNSRIVSQLEATALAESQITPQKTPEDSSRASAKNRARRSGSNTVKSRKEGKAKANQTPTTDSHVDQRRPSYGNDIAAEFEEPASPDGKRKRVLRASQGNSESRQTRSRVQSIEKVDESDKIPQRKAARTEELLDEEPHSTASTPGGGVRISQEREQADV